MTRGNPGHANDAHRSLPDDFGRELLALPGAVDLDPSSTGARDFQDTAEIVAGLDLVISVDTSVAHLAGAMGKPVWILLPAVSVDWRWMSARADTPWYPSARLFRATEAGGWRAVMDEVGAAMAKR
jgi:ADP-heptose:LPS heptosyltransferase